MSEVKVFGADYDSTVTTHWGDGQMALTIDEGSHSDVEATMVLDLTGVRKLRLACERFERAHRAGLDAPGDRG